MATTTNLAITLQSQDPAVDPSFSLNRALTQTITAGNAPAQVRLVMGSSTLTPVLGMAAEGAGQAYLLLRNQSALWSVVVTYTQQGFLSEAPAAAVQALLPPSSTLLLPGASYISDLTIEQLPDPITDPFTGQVYTGTTDVDSAIIDILAF